MPKEAYCKLLALESYRMLHHQNVIHWLSVSEREIKHICKHYGAFIRESISDLSYWLSRFGDFLLKKCSAASLKLIFVYWINDVKTWKNKENSTIFGSKTITLSFGIFLNMLAAYPGCSHGNCIVTYLCLLSNKH